MNDNMNLFSHELLARKISEFFSGSKKTNSFVVAINGVWGTGKTHLMNNVLGYLSDSDYIKITFNAWRYSQREEIWRALLFCILDGCQKYVKNVNNQEYLKWKEKDINIISQLFDETEKSLYTAFVKEIPGEISIDTSRLVKTGLNMALKFVPWGEFGSEVISKFFVQKNDKGEVVEPTIGETEIEELWGIFSRSATKRNVEKITSIEQFRHSFEVLMRAVLVGEYEGGTKKDTLSKHGKKIKLIVAIDDLDRCLPENTLEILEAIKLFMDFPGAYFMLAMDGDIIQQGLEMRYDKYGFTNIRAKDYYEKTIDLSFNIPPLLRDNFHLYVNSLTQYGEQYMQMYDVLSIALKSNLRAWERYVNRTDFNRSVLEEVAQEDIFADELVLKNFMKLQCFSYQWPEVYGKIYDYNTYIMLEKATNEIVSYSNKAYQEVVEELRVLPFAEELKNVIKDKKILDFMRMEPLISQIQNDKIINLIFTFDKVDIPDIVCD